MKAPIRESLPHVTCIKDEKVPIMVVAALILVTLSACTSQPNRFQIIEQYENDIDLKSFDEVSLIDNTDPNAFYSTMTFKTYSVIDKNFYEKITNKTNTLDNSECQFDVEKNTPNYDFIKTECKVGQLKVVIKAEKENISKVEIAILDSFSGEKYP